MKKLLKAFNGMFYLLDKRLEGIVEGIRDRDEVMEEMSDKLTDIEKQLTDLNKRLQKESIVSLYESEKELPVDHAIKETINIKGEGSFIQVSGRGVSSVKDRVITDEQWDSMTDEQKRNRYIGFYNEFPEPMNKNLIEDFRNSNTSLPNPVDHADAVLGGIFWDDFDEFFYEQLLNYLCK